MGKYYNNTVKNYTSINGLYAKYEYNSGVWTMASTYKKGLVIEKNEGTNRIELGTGSSDEFKRYNIYDMAGNIWEWTTGHNIKGTKMFAVSRGGSFDFLGSTSPVVCAGGDSELWGCIFTLGFRIVLYVK